MFPMKLKENRFLDRLDFNLLIILIGALIVDPTDIFETIIAFLYNFCIAGWTKNFILKEKNK